jgi:hypothetical protein
VGDVKPKDQIRLEGPSMPLLAEGLYAVGILAGFVLGLFVGGLVAFLLEVLGIESPTGFALLFPLIGAPAGAIAGRKCGLRLAERRRPHIPDNLDLSKKVAGEQQPARQVSTDSITWANDEIATPLDS